jgi:Tfp pilus assembly protein PilE
MVKKHQNGFFSMVGLIVVVVIIGLLFIMSVNYYRKSGAEKTVDQVTDDAINASLQTDLKAASMQIKLYLVQNNSYPDANDCSEEPAEKTICLKVSNLNKYIYDVDNDTTPPTFSLVAQNENGSSYEITQDDKIVKISDAN